jgi:hypothetical protein
MSDIEVIRVGKLHRPDYQNERFRPARAEAMGRDWRDALVGILVVSFRDGIHWTVDGNHRAAAAHYTFGPNHELRCEVFSGLSKAEEVELFLDLEAMRRRVTRWEKFQCHLSVSTREYVDIAQIAGSAGFSIAASNAGVNSITAIAALESIYGLSMGFRESGGSPALLRRTLTVSAQVWGPAGGGTDGRFLLGLATVLATYPEISDKALVKKLQAAGSVHQLLGRAPAGRSSGGYTRAVANVIIGVWNGNRRDANKLPYL